MTNLKKQKIALIITGVILSICNSLFSLSYFYDLLEHSDIVTYILIIGISFIPLILMLIGLFFTINRKSRIGYFIVLITSIILSIRDILLYIKNKEYLSHNPYDLPENILNKAVPPYESQVIIIEGIALLIFLTVLFSKNIRNELNVKLKQYLIVFGTLILIKLGFFAISYFNPNVENEKRLKPLIVTDYPTEIDSILKLDLKTNYSYKNYNIKVVNPVSTTTIESGGKKITQEPLIDTNSFAVTVRIILENDSIQIDNWTFKYSPNGELDFKYKF